jgi:hypothetical protein
VPTILRLPAIPGTVTFISKAIQDVKFDILSLVILQKDDVNFLSRCLYMHGFLFTGSICQNAKITVSQLFNYTIGDDLKCF